MDSNNQIINELRNPSTQNKAFSNLLDQYHEKLYWYVRKVVMTHDNANDVLQNTFLRIFKGINSFEEKSTLKTWMYKIAYNESIRFIEQNKKTYVNDKLGIKNHLEILSQDAYFDGDEIKLKLHDIVNNLAEKQKVVFQMKYFDELSFREISEILQISESTLKSSYYTAVKIIEEKIFET